MSGLLGITLADLTQGIDSRKREYANLISGSTQSKSKYISFLRVDD